VADKTNLEMIKSLMLDNDNTILKDDSYITFLMLHGLSATEIYTEYNEGKLMLAKADILDAIVENPDLFYNYTKGDINKDFKKEELIKQADKIRRRFFKFRG
jgi:hypothetical protein